MRLANVSQTERLVGQFRSAHNLPRTHMPKPTWAKVRGAYKVVKRTLFTKRDDTYDFQPDRQWTLVKDFRFLQHPTYSPNLEQISNIDDDKDDAKSSSNSEVLQSTEKTSDCATPNTTANDNASCSASGNHAVNNLINSESQQNYDGGASEENRNVRYKRDIGDEPSETNQVLNVTRPCTIENTLQMEDDNISLNEFKAGNNSPRTDAFAKRAKEMPAHCQQDSDSSVESYVDSSDDDFYDSESAFSESEGEAGSYSSSAKESSASDDSYSTDEEGLGCMKIPSLDTIVESDREIDAMKEDQTILRETVDDNQNKKAIAPLSSARSNEISETQSKVRSIRDMWKNIEKESENVACFPQAAPAVKAIIHNRTKPFVLLQESTNASKQSHELGPKITASRDDTTRGEPLVIMKREYRPAEDTQLQDCLRFSDVRKRWQEIKPTDDKTFGHDDAKSTRPKSSVVQRMAMQMQNLDEKVKMEEEMIANHRPLKNEFGENIDSQNRKSANLASDKKKHDDSFLKYLLEIGEQDEKNKKKSGHSKKPTKFMLFNNAKDRVDENPTKIHMSRTKSTVSSQSSDERFVDDSITDPYFRELLTSKTISAEVKTKLKQDFYAVFNNSKTPRGVKKSILDKLVIDFAING